MPEPESEDDEEMAEHAHEPSESPKAEAERAEALAPVAVEPTSEVNAEDTATLDGEQPESSRAAERPTTLLEELLGLPAPEYASLAAAPTAGAHSSHISRAQSLPLRMGPYSHC